jgi:hypothetical protein
MVLLAAVVVVPGIAYQAKQQQSGPSKIKRLILKDGSYELISQYEVKGARVRYFSSERHEWEELPYSLVDWAATEKYVKESAAENQSRARQLGENAAKERAEEQAAEVSPGLRLPDSGGVYLLDTFQGKPELVHLAQNGAEVDKRVAGNILRAVINPVAGSKQIIELPGPHARVQSHLTEPAIYADIDVDDSTPATQRARFRIVRCEEKKGNRVVGAMNIAVYGKVKQQANYVETRVEPAAGSWVKVRPAASLAAGEYALVEMLGENINTFVWDFGVNPAAPRNSGAVEREPEKKPPVLIQRKPR